MTLGALIADGLQEQIVCVEDFAVEIEFDDSLPASNRDGLGGCLRSALVEQIHVRPPLDREVNAATSRTLNEDR
jgi:hypothetical protein